MSITGGLKAAAAERAASRAQWLRANVKGWLTLLCRAPRAATKPAWRAPRRLAPAVMLALAILGLTCMLIDAGAIEAVPRLPRWLIDGFDALSDFGKSGWFLAPIGLVLALLAVVVSPALPRWSRLIVASLSVRLGYVFFAIALPGLFVTVVKRLIGRARPLVEGGADVLLYRPFGWSPEYASLPSGHATNACAAALAIGALWPRTRAVMWLYALGILLSRVLVTAHYPSDVLAGAMVGILGALLVRDWFAARRLGFVVGEGGRIHALPGPSLERIKRVARRLLAP